MVTAMRLAIRCCAWLGRGCAKSCRTTDLVARYGGEEFVWPFAAANLDEAAAQAETVFAFALLVTPVTLASGPLSVTTRARVSPCWATASRSPPRCSVPMLRSIVPKRPAATAPRA